MTQKELLYLEDAFKHEQNIISICEDTINALEDEELVSFLKKEVKKHENMKCEIKDMLEVKSND